MFTVRCLLLQLLSKGIVFKFGVQTGSPLPFTQSQLRIPIDRVLAQKLAPNARIVVWYITALGEIVADSLDFTVNGAFANEVSNSILNSLSSWWCFQCVYLSHSCTENQQILFVSTTSMCSIVNSCTNKTIPCYFNLYTSNNE